VAVVGVCAAMDDSDDDRGDSLDDGDEIHYTEEGSDKGSRKGSPEVKGIGEPADVIQNQPHDEAIEVGDADSDSSVASPASATMGPGDDDEFDQGGQAGEGEEEKVENQPFDEAIDISDDESVKSQDVMSSPDKGSPDALNSSHQAAQDALETPTRGLGDTGNGLGLSPGTSSSSESEDDEEGGEAMEAGDTVFTGEEGGYDPKEFEDLQVSEEIAQLFAYIGRYNPQKVELESVLQPVIPDYMPSVGDIDALIKLPRPDGKADNLGITVLDEPGLIQSDPAALELQLRHGSKRLDIGEANVRTIENAEHNSKQIKQWITSIDEVHKKQPGTEVTYSRPMPDIENLMQVWPPQFEDELSRTSLPSKDLDVSLEDYIRIVCAMFDIPIQGTGDKALTESLHVLFTLYSEFKNNDHFRNEMDAAASGGMFDDGGLMGIASPQFGMPLAMAPPGMDGAPGFHDTMGGIPGDMGLMVGGSQMSPLAPMGVYEGEVAMMGDEMNPPAITYHER